MADIYIDKRGVPRKYRNGRIYTQAASTNSSTVSNSTPTSAELLPTDNILEWDETSKSYKPYAAKKVSDPGFPYFYAAAGYQPSYGGNLLCIDGTLRGVSIQATSSLQIEDGNSATGYSLMSKLSFTQGKTYGGIARSISMGIIDDYGSLSAKISATGQSVPVIIGTKTISAGLKNGEHILIDDFLQTLSLNMSHVLFPKISAKTTPVDADSVLLIDSTDSSRTKKLTYANLKAALQTYFDPIYKLFESAVYEEINIGGLQLHKAGTNDPTIYSAGGLLLPVFSGSVLNELFFEITLPANYKPGTDIFPMVSWMPMTSPGTTQQVFWQLGYEWVNVGEVMTGTPSTKQYAHLTGTSGFKHIRAGLGTITGTGKTPSSALICRFSRDPANVNDHYTDGAGLISVGLKYQINAVGSAS